MRTEVVTTGSGGEHAHAVDGPLVCAWSVVTSVAVAFVAGVSQRWRERRDRRSFLGDWLAVQVRSIEDREAIARTQAIWRHQG